MALMGRTAQNAECALSQCGTSLWAVLWWRLRGCEGAPMVAYGTIRIERVYYAMNTPTPARERLSCDYGGTCLSTIPLLADPRPLAVAMHRGPLFDHGHARQLLVTNLLLHTAYAQASCPFVDESSITIVSPGPRTRPTRGVCWNLC